MYIIGMTGAILILICLFMFNFGNFFGSAFRRHNPFLNKNSNKGRERSFYLFITLGDIRLNMVQGSPVGLWPPVGVGTYKPW